MCKIEFGKYIRELRIKRNLSLSGLAKLVGITPFYISYMESGKKTNPDAQIMGRMIQAMKLNKQEIEQFLDLHAKANGCVSYDIVEYIMQHDEIREAIRSERDKLGASPSWEDFLNGFIKNKGSGELL